MTEPLYFTHLINSCGPDGLKYSITGEDDPVKGEDFVIFLYSILTESLGELDIFVKAYAQDRLHGDNPLELIGTVSSINLISDLSTFTQTATAEFDEPCISSISGTFKTKEGLKLVVPMMDLDIPSSGQSKEKIYHDLIPLISILMKNKVSGYILRSGDVGIGSYHFVCDFVVPYNPSFWQSIGWFMEIMVEEQFQNRNVVDSKRLGMSLSKAQTLEEARVIAN